MFIIVMPVIVPLFQSFGLGMVEVFELQAIFGLGIVVLEIPTGYLADVWGRKNALVVGGLFFGASFSCLSLATTYAHLVVYEIVVAVAFSFISGADVSFMYELIESSPGKKGAEAGTHGTKIFANFQMAQMAGEASAALLGGWLAATSLRLVIHVQVLMGWFPLILALTFPNQPKGRAPSFDRRQISQLVNLLFFKDSFMRLVLVNLIVWGLASFYAVWMLQKYWETRHIKIEYFGYLWAAYNLSVGLVGKQVHWLQRVISRRTLLLIIGILPVVGYFFMASTGALGGILLGSLFYVSRGINQVLLRELFNRNIPAGLRATANSIQTFLFRLVFSLTGPLLGRSIDKMGIDWTLKRLGLLFFGLGCAVLLPLWWQLGKQDRQPPTGNLI